LAIAFAPAIWPADMPDAPETLMPGFLILTA